MTTLSMTPIDEGEHKTPLQKKKIQRTLRRNFIQPDQVRPVLEAMQDEDENSPVSFTYKPLNPLLQQSRQHLSSNAKEGFRSLDTDPDPDSSPVPLPMRNDALDLNMLKNAHMSDEQARQYYQSKVFAPSTIHPSSFPPSSEQDGSSSTIQKLNYIIHLLEENRDQRTSNCTEEVVLYSFLGIFVIFLVDSFSRVGKYVR